MSRLRPTDLARVSTLSKPGRRQFLNAAVGMSSAWIAATLVKPARLYAATRAVAIASHKQVFVDPATEYRVTRWTEEAAESYLPTDPNRALSPGDSDLLYASNRTGNWQPYILHLKRGDSTQVAEARDLKPHSLALLRNGKEVVFLDGDTLIRNDVARKRSRDLYRSPEDWRVTGNLLLSHDDRMAAVTEQRQGTTRIVFVDTASGKSREVLRADGGLVPLGFHERYGLLVLNSQQKPALVGVPNAPRLPDFPEGDVLQARWDRSGKILIYLLRTQDGGITRHQLMEYDLDQGIHRFIANTTRFATFSANADASVFVGASASKAQPLLLLLLRVTKRELPLMEHRSSDAASVNPFFSNDSQTLFFESDRLGKTCIFSVSMEGLVEKT